MDCLPLRRRSVIRPITARADLRPFRPFSTHCSQSIAAYAPIMRPDLFVGYYSRWKAVALTFALFPLAGLLLLNARNGLTYTSLFHTRYGHRLLIVACSVLLVFAIAALPVIFRALANRPAIEISANTVRVWNLKWREYPLEAVVQYPETLRVFVRSSNGDRRVIPLWLYRNPEEVLAHLLEQKPS